MNTRSTVFTALLGVACIGGTAHAQPYDLDWHTVDGGGGVTAGFLYSLSGTIGQFDNTIMTGNGFELMGGFWASDDTNPPPVCGTADFDGDGDLGTDADIEAFFACLGGTCCMTCWGADFDGDGDVGTDADIEAFFRVLGGGTC
jgi:hypothetical protein